MPSFDAIICMDWLSNYQAVIVRAEKIVHIPWGNETLIIHGDGIRKKKRLEDVPIVQDFPEVFPEDLPGLPPTRQVEFQLMLVPCVSPPDSLKYSSTSRIKRDLISEGSHRIQPKIESIKDWTSPKSPTEIRQFLGLAGYYRRFIEGFSKIAKPMTKLTQKKVKFEWGDKQEAAFQTYLPSTKQNKDGQSERTIQTLEDRCRRACAIDLERCRITEAVFVGTELGDLKYSVPELIQATTEKIIQNQTENA
ncbi:hypothetical protein Tco_0291712 [Tanacetum coccineum]